MRSMPGSTRVWLTVRRARSRPLERSHRVLGRDHGPWRRVAAANLVRAVTRDAPRTDLLRSRSSAPADCRYEPGDCVSRPFSIGTPGYRAADVRAFRTPASRAVEVQHAFAGRDAPRCRIRR